MCRLATSSGLALARPRSSDMDILGLKLGRSGYADIGEAEAEAAGQPMRA